MTQFRKETLVASSVKKALKCYGISVLRCRQNNEGVLVTVATKSKDLAIKFFNEFGLSRYPQSANLPVSSSDKYFDFGTLYRFEEI